MDSQFQWIYVESFLGKKTNMYEIYAIDWTRNAWHVGAVLICDICISTIRYYNTTNRMYVFASASVFVFDVEGMNTKSMSLTIWIVKKKWSCA